LQISFSDDLDPDEGESYGLSTEMRRERELMGDYGFVCDRWMALSGCPMDHMIGNFQLKFGLNGIVPMGVPSFLNGFRNASQIWGDQSYQMR
jgi:hypothetical protein